MVQILHRDTRRGFHDPHTPERPPSASIDFASSKKPSTGCRSRAASLDIVSKHNSRRQS
jgi:hypothetical protein